ncbi:SDR family oxidoreductase [Streptomyces mexicanus]|uniref:SDR family oxidoreductase n=1 Tax=Streptomyces mexicanus TaxID=178566 RepID=A0A7X1HXS3_9ACTN|nr:SDR family oxidoreductase [Streptomyces mexicanus]MBC2864976.1 SDR family oxidoreductase [Streptomyces mexicanus]
MTLTDDDGVAVALREPPEVASMLPADTLAGRVALVTGGGSGLGLESAMAFARCGASVGLLGRTLGKTEKAARRIADETGVRAVGVCGDVRKADEVAAAFEAVENALGPISILANNAGANFPARSAELSANGFAAISRIALEGTFIASSEFFRRYLAAGLTRGAIVNNGAQYQATGYPGAAASSSAKAGVATLTRALAAEWAGDGVRVNSIVAGWFPHDGSRTATAEEADAKVGPRIVAGRVGRIREYGWLAAFLVSPYAAFVTGENVHLTGADHLRRRPIGFPYQPVSERENLWESDLADRTGVRR